MSKNAKLILVIIIKYIRLIRSLELFKLKVLDRHNQNIFYVENIRQSLVLQSFAAV